MFVYVIVNDVNLKIYIGKTTNPNLKQYLQSKISDAMGRRYHGRSHLLAAIRKYGREHFHIHPLYEGQTNEKICEQEKVLIKALGTQHPEIGYNICRGGEGRTGPLLPEAKAKFIERTPEKEALRVARLEKARAERGGSFLTEESIEKIKAKRAEQDESARLEAFNEWKEEKLAVDPDHFKKIGGRASREDKARAGRMGSRKDKRKAGLLGAKLGGEKARHTRWHAMRGKPSPECPLCRLTAS